MGSAISMLTGKGSRPVNGSRPHSRRPIGGLGKCCSSLRKTRGSPRASRRTKPDAPAATHSVLPLPTPREAQPACSSPDRQAQTLKEAVAGAQLRRTAILKRGEREKLQLLALHEVYKKSNPDGAEKVIRALLDQSKMGHHRARSMPLTPLLRLISGPTRREDRKCSHPPEITATPGALIGPKPAPHRLKVVPVSPNDAKGGLWDELMKENEQNGVKMAGQPALWAACTPMRTPRRRIVASNMPPPLTLAPLDRSATKHTTSENCAPGNARTQDPLAETHKNSVPADNTAIPLFHNGLQQPNCALDDRPRPPPLPAALAGCKPESNDPEAAASLGSDPIPPPPGVAPGGVPPPPPMDIFPGVPPPPPFALQGQRAPGLPNPSPLPPPSRAMKRLHWKAVPVHDIAGSLWEELAEESGGQSEADALPFDAFEQTFKKKTPPGKNRRAKARTPGTSASRIPAKTPSSARKRRIHAMNERRATNIGIGLAGLKLPVDALVQSLLNLDARKLEGDALSRLVKIFPSDEEIKIYARMPASLATQPGGLDKAELFFLRVAHDLPQPHARLQAALIMSGEFDQRLERTLALVAAARLACATIRSSSKIREVLKAVLRLGNFMNTGKGGGYVYGFRLQTLGMLASVRSAYGSKESLLEFLAALIDKRHGTQLADDMLLELDAIEDAAKASPEELGNAVAALASNLSFLKSCTDTFAVGSSAHSKVAAFHDSAQGQWQRLQSEHQALGSDFASLCKFFGHSNMRWDDFFRVWQSFRSDYRQARVRAAAKKRSAASRTSRMAGTDKSTKKKPRSARKRKIRPGDRRRASAAGVPHPR